MDFTSSKELQMMLFDEHPDGIYILNPLGVFLDGNPAAELLSGFSKQELIGKNFAKAKLLPVSQIPKAGLMIAQILAGGHPPSQEFTLIRKDKSKIEVELSTRRIILDGEWYILGSARDISFRKKALDQIKHSEEKYASIFKNATDGILYLNRKGLVLDSNPMATEILGIPAEKLIGHYVVELARRFISARELPRILKSMGQMLQGKSIVDFSIEYNNRFIEISIPSEQKTKGLTAIFRDITERVLALDELKRSEEKFRAIVENAQPVIFVLDSEGTFLVSEGKSLARLGLKSGQVVGISAFEVYKDFPVVIHAIKLGLKGQVTNVKIDLGIANFDAFFSPYRDSNGKVIGVIGMAIDITEMKQTEKALIVAKENAEESDRLKSAFVANISHEIRTPLNSILGFSELLCDHEIDKHLSEKYFHIIHKGGEQLISIINNLLDISIIESGRLVLTIEKINLLELFENIHAQFLGIDSELDNRIKIVEAPKLKISTDKIRLTQVLNNLISNAVKYTDTGEILIGYSLIEKQIRFYVSDEGGGIPLELKDKIFDRFFRIQHSDRIANGSGLGLSITKAIVEEMGGRIWFESDPNKGTSFFFTIPM